jgi:polyribonucleotide nucleotidyltransferase
MKEVTKIEKEIGAQKLIMETGKIARQSHGSLTLQYGDTVVLATVLSAPPTRQIDYFPLYVDYREMQYAGGKFPGGFFKREGRPSGKEILTSRMIDRTIRPLWPKDFNNEVQIQCMVVSADKDNDADMLSIIGGSAALALSPAPFLGPIAAVRVGRVDGEFVVFPTFKQRDESDFDLIVAGHRDAVNMIELGGQEVDEDTVAKACAFGFEHIQTIIGMIDELTKKAGAEKTYESTPVSEELMATVLGKCGEKLRQAKQIKDKAER